MSKPATLLDKLWRSHEITQREDGTSLLWVDRHLVHEGSHHAFAKLAERQLTVAEPSLTFAVTDHYVPTRNRFQIQDASIARMINTLQQNAHAHNIELFGLEDPRQGIVHVIGPELHTVRLGRWLLASVQRRLHMYWPPRRCGRKNQSACVLASTDHCQSVSPPKTLPCTCRWRRA